MKQIIIISGCIILLFMPLAHSMNLALKKIPKTLQQKKELSKRSYRHETMVCCSSLKQMPIDFCEMVDSCKRAELKIMPTQLLFVYAVATALPSDVVQKICLFMCDGNEDDAQYFYTTPIGRAVNWYHENR